MTKATALDDLDWIRKIDGSNMLSFCVEAPRHYGEAARLAEKLSVNYPSPQEIIVSGMGGSAIGGDLFKDWSRETIAVPVEVNREYSLPAYADENTLSIVVSYSGETEESLSTFLESVKRKCMTLCLSSGGALQEFANKLGVPHLRVPSSMTPRATLPYLFMPLPVMFGHMGLVSNVSEEIAETVKVLKHVSGANKPEKRLGDNFCKTLASCLSGTVPVVYGFGFYRAVAERFKTQFNENSKVPAKWEYFSELNHNEIVGWEAAHDFVRFFSLILVRDDNEPPAIHQRIVTTKELVASYGVKAFEVRGMGESKMAKMASLICIGDFVSVYLGVLNGIDPTPVKTINLLKEKVEQTGVKAKVVRELQNLAKR